MGISEATEILKNSSMGLYYSVRPKKHPICVNLKSQDTFDALISWKAFGIVQELEEAATAEELPSPRTVSPENEVKAGEGEAPVRPI
ncbi:hypothetical protein Acr_18g0006040 [Actinidia rufa]|uniref:Uncharacterized protein n=1 Tax=Actinidia rufa TaxID=165716 RepID=A0A7J0G6L0_9ERIC|nr:hypothetical protein Acr_18g0006040 [Actinidia rufa]